MEYMVILAFVLVLLLPIIYTSVSKSTSNLQYYDAKTAVDKVGKAADLVYAQGVGARSRVTVFFPSGITAYGLNNSASGGQVWVGLSTPGYSGDVYYNTIGRLKGNVAFKEGYNTLVVEMSDAGYVAISQLDGAIIDTVPTEISESVENGTIYNFQLNVTNMGAVNATNVTFDVVGDSELFSWITFISSDSAFNSTSRTFSSIPSLARKSANVSVSVPSNVTLGTLYKGAVKVSSQNGGFQYVKLELIVPGAASRIWLLPESWNVSTPDNRTLQRTYFLCNSFATEKVMAVNFTGGIASLLSFSDGSTQKNVSVLSNKCSEFDAKLAVPNAYANGDYAGGVLATTSGSAYTSAIYLNVYGVTIGISLDNSSYRWGDLIKYNISILDTNLRNVSTQVVLSWYDPFGIVSTDTFSVNGTYNSSKYLDPSYHTGLGRVLAQEQTTGGNDTEYFNVTGVIYLVTQHAPSMDDHEEGFRDLLASQNYTVEVKDDAAAASSLDLQQASLLLIGHIRSTYSSAIEGRVKNSSRPYMMLGKSMLASTDFPVDWDLATAVTEDNSQTQIAVSTNQHYITENYSVGSLAVYSSGDKIERLKEFTGTTLATFSSQTALGVLKNSDHYLDGSPAKRRVAAFGLVKPGSLNSNGQTLFLRAVRWLMMNEITLYTDKYSYERNDTVVLSGDGYNPNTNYIVTIQNPNGTYIFGYPKTVVSTQNGTISDQWAISANSSFGSYLASAMDVSNASYVYAQAPFRIKPIYTIYFVSKNNGTDNLDQSLEKPFYDIMRNESHVVSIQKDSDVASGAVSLAPAEIIFIGEYDSGNRDNLISKVKNASRPYLLGHKGMDDAKEWGLSTKNNPMGSNSDTKLNLVDVTHQITNPYPLGDLYILYQSDPIYNVDGFTCASLSKMGAQKTDLGICDPLASHTYSNNVTVSRKIVVFGSIDFFKGNDTNYNTDGRNIFVRSVEWLGQ